MKPVASAPGGTSTGVVDRSVGRRARRVLLAAALAAVAGVAAAAQREDACPHCDDDPEVLAAAGLVSHGPFPFATQDSAAVEAAHPELELRWLETRHFRLGMALPRYKIGVDERDKIRAEMARLDELLRDVPEKPRYLDPWLRLHLYGLRIEDAWRRVQEVLRVEDADFPAPGRGRRSGAAYMGEGPHLGQREKFEILILPEQRELTSFLSREYGLPFRTTQRWNHIPRDAITLTIHTEEGQLRDDRALHGHVVYNVAHNLLDGYKHYNYDTPIWIHEGLGHVLERELDPRFNSFHHSEGALSKGTTRADWKPPVLRLVRSGEAPPLARLVRMREYGDLSLDDHYTVWSMVDYLLSEHAEGFACLVGRLKGQVGDDGIPRTDDLLGAHREAFAECIGMGYPELDAAWAAWVQATY